MTVQVVCFGFPAISTVVWVTGIGVILRFGLASTAMLEMGGVGGNLTWQMWQVVSWGSPMMVTVVVGEAGRRLPRWRAVARLVVVRARRVRVGSFIVVVVGVGWWGCY
jgi:hypothetical protein